MPRRNKRKRVETNGSKPRKRRKGKERARKERKTRDKEV